MENKTIRQSNFEMLRLLAMLMLIPFHIVNNGLIEQIKNPVANELIDGSLFHHAVFYKRLLLPETITTFGKTADGIFILISGYFLGYRDVDIVKSAKKLFGQLLFAAILLVLGSNIYYQIHPEHLIYLPGINIINEAWWFVGYYLGIIIVAYLFINKYLQRTDKKGHQTLLVICFTISCCSWLGGLFSSLAKDLRILIVGVFMYALGAYIRKYDPFKSIPAHVIILFILGIYILVWISFYNTNIWNIENYLLQKSNETFNQSLTWYNDYNTVPIAISISVFELFKRLHTPNYKIINKISSASFMVYLIHVNPFSYYVMRERDWQYLLKESCIMFCLELLLWSICIYAIGGLIYAVYHSVHRGFERILR